MKNNNENLVYSTETGRITQPSVAPVANTASKDGIVRIHRQTAGRGGKGVMVIMGIDSEQHDLAKIAKQLKAKLACGGAVKDGTVEIQGENRDKAKQILEAMGFTVKLAGG